MKSFLYLHTNDLRSARRFYSDVLGLDEIFVSDDVVGYRIGTLQLTVARHDAPLRPEGWSGQLGWSGGANGAPSVGFEIPDDAFAAIVDRLRTASVETWTDAPTWVGYWSFPVRDPMGNTVEVSASGREAFPAST